MNHYINEDGLTVFTSDYHRKKGSCCHSNCLHCPFGTTLKNFGVKIHLSNEENKQMRDNLFQILFGAPDGVMGELLGEAFGKPKKQKVEEQNQNQLQKMLLVGADLVVSACDEYDDQADQNAPGDHHE